MNNAIELPEITRTLLTGYPKPVAPIKLIGYCACGCGEEVTAQYAYVELDDEPFIDSDHILKALRKQGRLVEVG